MAKKRHNNVSFTACSFESSGRVNASGVGPLELKDKFFISANWIEIEMIVTGWTQPGDIWYAQDVASFEKEFAHRG